jgi:hypothetical protein
MSTARPERAAPLHGAGDPADAAPRRAFALGCIVLFVACAAATVSAGVSMSAMAALPMRGGWSLSMHWLAMCGRNAPAQMAAWLGMWSTMMVAMMLPAVAPNLWRYRCAAMHAGATHPTALTVCMGVGYLLVWIAMGAVISVLGTTLATGLLERLTLARAAPLAMGAVLMLAGALQCTAWKARQLTHCRHWPASAGVSPAHFRSAWRAGLSLGCHCISSCIRTDGDPAGQWSDGPARDGVDHRRDHRGASVDSWRPCRPGDRRARAGRRSVADDRGHHRGWVSTRFTCRRTPGA